MNYLYNYSKFSKAVWSEQRDDWDTSCEKWKVIGNYKNFHEKILQHKKLDKLTNLMHQLISEKINVSKKYYFVVKYKSGRLDIGVDNIKYDLHSFIIIEADRGVDCGKIIAIATEEEYNKIIKTLKIFKNEIEVKKIMRYAEQNDIFELEVRKQDEKICLEQCRNLVSLKNLNMDILSCEYQWDKKKITFYFKSCKRIDFRDLLNDLFKLFKIRIWLCAEKRSPNLLIKLMLKLH
ncbi:signal peptidase-like protein [Vairimorpha apis BRL 01]|uniref:Signal peptidase-like protein n=1 Tax=Vairimorpha apis BRL 01 TaxID=1037528 RepID=T0L810_9MICR|nr:signal peptidase-like protein [Vairimorpha apis BRL 01]